MILGSMRIGKVSSINYETGMMRVTYTDKNKSVTREFPMLNYGSQYHMPEIGQSVAVAHLSNGSSRGVILGTVWNKNNLPAEGKKGVYRQDFSKTTGAAVQQYTEDTGKMVIKAPNISVIGNNETELEGAKLVIGANIQLLLDTPKMELAAQTVKWEEIQMEVLSGTLTALMTGLNLELEEILSVKAKGDIDLETEGDMDLKTQGAVSVASAEEVSIEAQGNISMSALQDADLAAEGTVSVTASGDLLLKDKTYNTSLSEIAKCLEALGQTLGKG